jgi:nucleotide-binding universal stress UspA family protein
VTVSDTSRAALRDREFRRVTTQRWAPASAGIVVGISQDQDPAGVLTWATREARVLHAPLVICHAGKGEQADAVLSRAGALARRGMPAGQVETVRGEGRPITLLASVADQAGIVVLGTDEGVGSGAPLAGTAAVRIASEGRCAAVVARPTVRTGDGPFPGYVMVGVDGSAHSRAALGYAFAHAAAHRRPLVAVHVTTGFADDFWRDSDLIDSEVTDDRAANALIEHEVRPFAERFRTVRVSRVAHRGRPLPVLSRVSRGAALLAVGVHGRPSSTRSRLGSTARGVLLDPTTTVAAVRATAA